MEEDGGAREDRHACRSERQSPPTKAPENNNNLSPTMVSMYDLRACGVPAVYRKCHSEF